MTSEGEMRSNRSLNTISPSVLWKRGCGFFAVLALIAAFVASANPSDAHGAIHAEHGHGAYGQTDVITRADLEPGIAQLVSDEAIEAANDPTFAAARQSWDLGGDFVDQIDYQLRFRSLVDFMSSDYGHIARLLEERPDNMGSRSMGLFMTNEEVTEMLRRDELGDRMDATTEIIVGDQLAWTEGETPTYGPDFAGVWQDQLDGGRIIIAVTPTAVVNEQAIAKLLGGADQFRVVKQEYSYDEVEQYRQILESELRAAGVSHDVAAVRGDWGRLLEVRVSDPSVLPNDFAAGVPADVFWVTPGDAVVQAGYPTHTHSTSDQQPGLDVATFDEDTGEGEHCTWGFNGHTSTFHYIVTAGHCMPDGLTNYTGGVVEEDGWAMEMYQNGSTSRLLTPGSTFLRSLNNAYEDAARLESTYANDNCYHGNAYYSGHHCQWPMANRALDDSWEVGSDRTCASLGATNTYRCGYIEEENTSGDKVRVSMIVNPGDSGSGMKWDYRIDGILTDRGGTEAFFMTAYDVQRALGNGYFYFNCYSPGSITRSDPSDWGACPSVDA